MSQWVLENQVYLVDLHCQYLLLHLSHHALPKRTNWLQVLYSYHNTHCFSFISSWPLESRRAGPPLQV